MIRNYSKETDSESCDQDNMDLAEEMVKTGTSLRSAASTCNVPRSTLKRRCSGFVY